MTPLHFRVKAVMYTHLHEVKSLTYISASSPVCMGPELEGGVGETQHRLLTVEEGVPLSYTVSRRTGAPSFIGPVSCWLIAGQLFGTLWVPTLL